MISVLFTAGRLLGRPTLCNRALSLAASMIERASARGRYTLGLPSAGQLESRGLFQGTAGIGYALLRLARPDLVPDVLLFE
jgi:lantibiotic modifying enzyme